MRWEWFKNKKLRFLMIWSQGTLGVIFSLGRIFTLRRLCCIFGGTRSVFFIMSCWNQTKPSLENVIERNWYVWAEHCAKNGHNTSRGTKKWFYSMTTLALTLPNPLNPAGTAQMGSPTPPAVLPRYCAVRLLLVPVDGTWSDWSAVPLIWRHRKMTWFVDSLKRWTLLL